MTATVVIAHLKIKCLIVRIDRLPQELFSYPFRLRTLRSAGTGLADPKEK